MCLLHPPCWDPIWPCVCCHFLCEFNCAWVLLCLEITIPLESSITSSIFPHPLLWTCQVGRVSKDILFRTELSKVSHFLHIVHLWVTVLIAIYCKKLIWCGGSKALICTCVIYQQGSLLCSFNRIIVVGFLLSPWYSLIFLTTFTASGVSSIS